ncbi:hypothetical protein [Streptomyces hygroscopicus]|uniref:hypothetical protein n=1 Tax=Streptomyces hygroscopicus TaxID=1912 RepID=UPI00223FE6D3|nr:hypothetical protein [Streptomyces hygroscopicus]
MREEAGRIQAELAAAEKESQEWAISRRRVGAVLDEPAAGLGGTAVADPARRSGDRGAVRRVA